MLYTQLRSFHAVAREGGFTAASKALKIGQPTITSQVRALEQYFGVELFHRRGRRVALSDTGSQLFAITRRIMSLEQEASDLLNASGGFHVGLIKVGAVGPYHATEMLSAFHQRFPELKISVTIGNSREVRRQLLDYEVDVAVLAQEESDPRFHAVPYSRHPVVVFVNRDHRWYKRRKALRIAELQGQPLILREVGSTTRLAFEKALERAGVTIDPVMEIGSREAVWLAVERGVGIAVVSEFEFIPHPHLRALPIADAEIFTTAHVLCLADRRESRLIRAFFGVVEALVAARAAPGGPSPPTVTGRFLK